MKSCEGACLLPLGCPYLPALGRRVCVNRAGAARRGTEGWVDACGGRMGGLEPTSIHCAPGMPRVWRLWFQPGSHMSPPLVEAMSGLPRGCESLSMAGEMFTDPQVNHSCPTGFCRVAPGLQPVVKGIRSATQNQSSDYRR